MSKKNYCNSFAYDRNSRIVYGYYDDNINIRSLADIVSTVLSDKEAAAQANKVFNSGIKIIGNIGSNIFNDDSDDNIVDNFLTLLQKIDDDVKTPEADEFDILSVEWINAIELENDIVVKRRLITEYIRIIGEFVKTNIRYGGKLVNDPSLCTSCHSILFIGPNQEEQCTKCDNHAPQFITVSKYVDMPEVVDVKTVRIEDPFLKFQKHYLRYQGRFSATIPNSDITKIKERINEKYNKLKHGPEWRSANLKILRQTLASLKMSKYKHDVNLIANIIWGWELHRTDHLDAIIEQNWRKGQEYIIKAMNDGDTDTIGHNDWRLYMEYKYVGFECDKDDFLLPSSKKTLRRYEALWEARCKAFTNVDE